MSDTVICVSCGGYGDYWVQVNDRGTTEMRTCQACHGSGQSGTYRAKALSPNVKDFSIESAILEFKRAVKRRESR